VSDPLNHPDGKQRNELRSLSSRAEITAIRFANEYSYGSFRGSPETMMERYFDAFCYLANWGTRQLMFRFPRALLDAETARRYCHSDAASVTETADHVIISLRLDRDPDNEWLEGESLLGTMAQARAEVAAGDLRLLYLAWLLSIQQADEDEDFKDEFEPQVPAGLADLSAPRAAIADFLEIDEDLIAVVAEASPPLKEPADDGLADWIAALPAAEKDTLLTMLANGDGAQAQALLLRRFRGAAAEAAAYEKGLDDLAADEAGAWQQVGELIAAKKTSDYDVAVALLRDLRVLAKRQGDSETATFRKRASALRAHYPSRPALQSRLDKSGLPAYRQPHFPRTLRAVSHPPPARLPRHGETAGIAHPFVSVAHSTSRSNRLLSPIVAVTYDCRRASAAAHTPAEAGRAAAHSARLQRRFHSTVSHATSASSLARRR
jgi:hypothetical protein